MIKCWEKIKAFFKRSKPEAKGAEEKAAEPPEAKTAKAPEKKARRKMKP